MINVGTVPIMQKTVEILMASKLPKFCMGVSVSADAWGVARRKEFKERGKDVNFLFNPVLGVGTWEGMPVPICKQA